MKKLLIVLMLSMLLLSVSVASIALAKQDKSRGCPEPFHLEPFLEHEGHHHQHIGLTLDHNQDGYICVKHIGDKHLHIDNNVRK